jgi:hypothetical protein
MPTDSKRKRNHHAKPPISEPEVIEQMVWWCEACKASGRVFYTPDEGIWEVFTKVHDSHRKHELAKWCRDTTRIRVELK